MDPSSKAELAESVNTLIEDGGARQMFTQLCGVLQLKQQGIPVALTGHPAVLNALLNLAVADPAAYERVLELIERKRKERGLEPLVDIDVEQDRKAYMREFMATKRDRQRRLIELLNDLRSEAEKIKGTARIELERVHAARWLDEKDAREDTARKRLGRRLTADERRAISTQLWAEVDQELDALEQFVQVQMKLPLMQRKGNTFRYSVGEMKGNLQ